MMKCTRCRERAIVQLRHHNSNFCQPCFLFFFERQVERAVEKDRMCSRDEDILVAVSGGKDSLALWDVFIRLGYRAAGLHLALGIGEYSRTSADKTQQFAQARGQRLITVRLEEDGPAIPELAAVTRRPACAACGITKRHYFDKIAADHGFPVLATGHNLDDEAARLLGNVLHWSADQLAKQRPVLQPTHEKFVRKIKPLYRVTEYETAVYAFLRKIDYIVDECPNANGATQLVYKDALNRIEAASPGTKLNFVQEFLKTGQPAFAAGQQPAGGTCNRCGMPAYGEVCSYCGLLASAERKREARQTPSAS